MSREHFELQLGILKEYVGKFNKYANEGRSLKDIGDICIGIIKSLQGMDELNLYDAPDPETGELFPGYKPQEKKLPLPMFGGQEKAKKEKKK